MSVTIRLVRIGKKGKANYRIVAIDTRKKRNGRYIEKIGFYNPLVNPPVIDLDQDKVKKWLEKGALLSEGMRKLLIKKGST